MVVSECAMYGAAISVSRAVDGGNLVQLHTGSAERPLYLHVRYIRSCVLTAVVSLSVSRAEWELQHELQSPLPSHWHCPHALAAAACSG